MSVDSQTPAQESQSPAFGRLLGHFPFHVVIIQSSASEDRLRAAIAALGHLALPRKLPAGYYGVQFRELQLLRLPTVAGAAASDHGLPEGGEPKARASADITARASADGAAALR